jgi:hypothetical protein
MAVVLLSQQKRSGPFSPQSLKPLDLSPETDGDCVLYCFLYSEASGCSVLEFLMKRRIQDLPQVQGLT